MKRMGLCSIASCLIGLSAVASPSPPSSEVFQDCPACPQMKVVPAGVFRLRTPLVNRYFTLGFRVARDIP